MERALARWQLVLMPGTGPQRPGVPVCSSSGSVEAYEARRPNGSLRFRCKGCKKDFTITSGTQFDSHKLPLRGYLAAIAVSATR